MQVTFVEIADKAYSVCFASDGQPYSVARSGKRKALLWVRGMTLKGVAAKAVENATPRASA